MTEMATPTTITERDYYEDPDVREAVLDQCLSLSELYAADPERSGFALPEQGGWIIVKELPCTSIPNPPRYSIWRARPVYSSRTFRLSARKEVSWPMLKARISTQHGDLDLLPGEYVPTKIERWLDLIGEGVTINFLGAEPDELGDRSFYLRAHGLNEAQAAELLLPDIQTNDFLYLTLDLPETE